MQYLHNESEKPFLFKIVIIVIEIVSIWVLF